MIRPAGFNIECDDCGRTELIPCHTEERLTSLSKALGWRKVDLEGAKLDLCKHCIDKRLQERIKQNLGPLVYV